MQVEIRPRRASRSAIVALACALLCAAGASSCGPSGDDGPAGPKRRSGPPDIVLLTVETWRADRLALLGSPRPTSPWLDELSKDALVFEKAVPAASWTWPSMVSIVTGLLPSEHGVAQTHNPVPDAVTTLAEVLKDGGYRTAFVGSNLYFVPDDNGWRQGYETAITLPGLSFSELMPRIQEVLVLGHADPRPLFLHVHVFDPHCPFAPMPDKVEALQRVPLDRSPDCKASEFLCASDDRTPFLDLMAGMTSREARSCFLEPDDGEPPGGLRKLGPLGDTPEGRAALGVGWPEILDQYDAEILETDGYLRQIAEALQERGRWDSAWVAIMGDHGEEFGEHARVGHGENIGMETAHVPLLLRAPAGEQREIRGRVREPVTLTLVAPTLAKVAGLEGPAWWADRDLRAWADPSAPHAPIFVASEIHTVRMVWTEGHRLYVDRSDERHKPGGLAGEMHSPDRPWHLYAEDDVRDRHDLLDESQPPELRDAAAALAARMAAAGPDSVRVSPYFPPEQRPADPEFLRQLRALGYTGN